jgi:hypothetical protein
MKRIRDDERRQRNRRWKYFRRRLQEQEWNRQRHAWRMVSKVSLKQLEEDEENEER